MRLYWTRNTHLYNFLWQRGIKPIAESAEGSAAYYPNKQLKAAIESYHIRHYYFCNKR